jgi:hypothetical protein
LAKGDAHGGWLYWRNVSMKNAVLGMLRHVALVRTDVSEECSTSIIRVTWISKLGTTLAITSNWHMLWRNTITTTSISLQRASVASYC